SLDSVATPVNVGVMVERNAKGAGDISPINVQLTWNFGIDGITNNDNIIMKVFAIEMVYIPQGAFYAGAGTTREVSPIWTSYNQNSTPFNVTNENAIQVKNTLG